MPSPLITDVAAEVNNDNNAMEFTSATQTSKTDALMKDSNSKDAIVDGKINECSIQANENSMTSTSAETPPITSAIILSLSNKHIYELINPLLSDSLVTQETNKENLIASLNELLDSNKLTPEKFWELALANIPWTVLQGAEYSVVRLKKVHVAENKTKAKKMSLAKTKQNPKKIKEPIDLPPPANPPHYTKAEVVQVLTKYKPMSVIMDKIIALKYVDCGRSQLYRALKVHKDGGELNTPRKKEPKASSKPSGKEPELPLELPEPASPPYYSEEQVMKLISDLPASTNPPYYSKAQTANLLLKCGPYEKGMIKKLVEQELVPVSARQLCHFVKQVKEGKANLTKSWKSKRDLANTDAKKTSKKRKSESEEGQSAKKKQNISKNSAEFKRKKQQQKSAPLTPALCEVFMTRAKSMDDAEFVRHVTVEMERRGYTFGLKLVSAKSDNKEKIKRNPKKQQKDEDGGKCSSAQSVGGGGITEIETRDDEIRFGASDHNELQLTEEKGGSGTVASETTTLAADDDMKKTIAHPSPLPLNVMFFPSTKETKLPNIERWNRMYDQLKSFYEEHGHLEVADVALKKWVNVQMNQWIQMQNEGSQHCMTLYKVRRLNALGFGDFALKSNNATSHKGSALTEGQVKREAKKEKLWNERLMELKAFKETYGSTVIPRHINDLLSKWSYKQRVEIKKFREGDTNTTMTQEKIDKLEEIGFDTRCESSKVRQEQRQRSMIKAEVKWEENFDALVAYKQLFGTTEVNEKMGDEGEYKKLAGWVGLQRTKYKKKMNGQLHGRTFEITDDQIKRLASIGFDFAGKRLDFETRFKQVLEFKKQHKHTRIPVFYAEHNNLGRWAKRMRDGIRTNEPWVNEIHKARLLGIGFDIQARQVFDHPRKTESAAADGCAALDFA